MIDIIIPAYNSHDTIIRTLSSIASQSILDRINVTIVNDASKKDYTNEISLFTSFMNIKVIDLKKNVGPGQARQIGIENSNSEYIIFIDSDDTFYEEQSVSKLYDGIKDTKYDMLVSKFLTEKEDGSLEEEHSLVWLHGKIYKRKFLDDNKIKFNNSYANEDNGFNTLIYLLDSNIGWYDEITYIWCKNENSITRKNNREYNYIGKYGYIYNMTWAFENAIKRGINNNKIKEKILCVILSIYLYYLEFMSIEGVEEMLEKSKKLKKIYEDHKLDDITLRNKIFIEECHYLLGELKNVDFLYNKISFEEFLERIGD